MGALFSPPKAPKPDPATQATSTTDFAKRRAELERRKRKGYFSSYFSQSDDSQVGGGSQTVG